MKAALAHIEARHEALLAALDGHDAAAIEQASAALGESLEAVRALESRAPNPELRPAVTRIRRLAEAGTMRVNLLADHTRRRADALSAMRGQPVSATYTR